VSLRFEGEGRRNVRVGYMHEMPVWKMTYRLLLADNGEHLMQGWAVVENTSEQDWNDVHLSLVSGQPISFEMPLYEPLYVDRPTVQLDLYAGLRPQKYEQELAAMEARGKGVQEKRAALAERQRRAAVPQAAKADRKVSADALRQTAQGRATAAEVGELFRYEIETGNRR